MSPWLIVPVKPLRDAKSRLSPILSPAERCELAHATLRHVLRIASAAASIRRVLVVSRDEAALSLARETGADALRENADCDLNGALRLALRTAKTQSADAALILPADLPFVTADDIEATVRLSRDQSIVIATDRAGDGTNALFLRPPDIISPAYGPASFEKHCRLAREACVSVQRYTSRRLALDIDTPGDLYAYMDALRKGGHDHLPRFDLPQVQAP